MKRVLIAIILATLFLSLSLADPIHAQQKKKKEKGKIEEFEKEIDKKKKEEKQKEEPDQDTEEGSSFFHELVFEILIKPLFVWTFIGPPGDDSILDSESFLSRYFTPFPYAVENAGIYSENGQKSFAITLWGHYFYNNSQLQGYGLRSRLAPLPFLSVDLRFTELTEKLESGEDQLQVYDVLVNYYRIRTEHLALWWGIGIKGIYSNKNRLGVALNLGSEIYPFKPISLHVNYNISSVNYHTVNDFLIHLNWHLDRYFIYSGYQRFSTGSALLNGVIGGIGVHF